ncbi:hypothetical protein N7G274_006985 [Stereocaulon virgatum]|uniref:DUF676 domain-containing protein n=1 Tax=Stereocaulon virgatum TaxID=373712 RepID=A0ABR4A6R6_9LECA
MVSEITLDGNDPLVDIFAVHALNSQRDRIWTFEGTKKGTNKDVLWLRDLLPARTRRARIWKWGCDSRTHSKSHQDHLIKKSLYEHGRDLVIDLDNERRASNSCQRPFVFVTHSLGGIVVKCHIGKSLLVSDPGFCRLPSVLTAIKDGYCGYMVALLHSNRMREGHLEKERSIKLFTYGIIFMGTPHQGGQGVSVGEVMLNVAKIQGHTSDDLLKHLEQHSEFLQQQLCEFTAISQDFDISFAYETKPTPIIGGTAKFIVRE